MFDLNRFNENIHGMRGLAALFVFLLHIYHNKILIFTDYDIFTLETVKSLKSFVSFGSAGVEIFFVISGFLITASLLRHRSISSFLVDRAIRIYPVFLSIHVPLFLVLPLVGWKWMADIGFIEWLGYFISNLLFLPGVFDFKILQSNAWTLSYELLFYLVSCFIYFTLRGRRNLGLYLLSIFIVVTLLYIFPRGVYFLVGAACYLLLRRDPNVLCSTVISPTLMFFVLLVMLGPLRGLIETDRAAIHSDDILTKLAIVPMFFMFMGVIRSQGVISIFLKTKLMQFFGKVSYSLYLWHAVVLSVGSRLFEPLFIKYFDLPPLVAVCALIVSEVLLVIVVSMVSYSLFEDKLGRFLKRLKNKTDIRSEGGQTVVG